MRSPLGVWYGHLRQVAYSRIATEISTLSAYCDRLYYTTPSENDVLFGKLVCAEKLKVAEADLYPGHEPTGHGRDLIVFGGTFNSSLDVQGILLDLKTKLSRGDRVAAVLYNPYFRWLYRIVDRLGLRQAPPVSTFVTRVDMRNLAEISGYEVVRVRPCGCFPLRLLGIGRLLDGVLGALPGIRRLAPAEVVTLRPILQEPEALSLSVVIPVRNEKGNIEAALSRLPRIAGAGMEVIFVEGHSTDGTWQEVLRATESTQDLTIRAFQQSGKGKADAVRLGFSHATGDLLTILDGDLTMPPEMLLRFYDAYHDGHGDFINGSRLVYPMEDQAMRFLNRLGNIFFAKILSSVLDVQLGDTLCGTKLVHRRDYERMVAWRRDWGEFDPFGDFELLFPAATLALAVVDVPVRYRDRTYGSTNIARFRDGLRLAGMATLGLFRIRMGMGWDMRPLDSRDLDGRE